MAEPDLWEKAADHWERRAYNEALEAKKLRARLAEVEAELAEAEFCSGCNGGEWTWQRRAEEAEAKLDLMTRDRDGWIKANNIIQVKRNEADARLAAAQARVDAMVDGMGTSYDYRGVSAEAVFELAELLRGEGDPAWRKMIWPKGCRCHNRSGLEDHQHENDCPSAEVDPVHSGEGDRG